MATRKWSDVREELFGKRGTKRRESYERFVINMRRKVVRAKKNGTWPQPGQIYWNDFDEELHLVVESAHHLVWTHYGNKHIEACGHSGGLSPDSFAYIGEL